MYLGVYLFNLSSMRFLHFWPDSSLKPPVGLHVTASVTIGTWEIRDLSTEDPSARAGELTWKPFCQQFAIRTTIRNHTTLNRDSVIKQVADAVGSRHSVDLKNYDVLILVEIYKVS